MQDARSAFLHNQGARRANEVRQRRATVENPQWAMSRSADWYQNRDNLRSIKGTLASIPAVTTDQNESRNMYQMLMNQMKGGDRGARLLDTSGLPAGARRIGRQLFTDPAKSQGFFGDVASMFLRKPNPSAVIAPTYNPFPKAGFGAEWYKDQFPIESGFSGIMNAAENFIPGASWAKKFLPKRNRIPLERDLSWVPEDVGEYDEVPMIDFEDEMTEDEMTEDDYIYKGEFPGDTQGNVDSGYYGIVPSSYMDDLTEKIVEEGIDEDNTSSFIDLDDSYYLNPSLPGGASNYSGVVEYLNSIIQDPDNPNYKRDRQELLEELIKKRYIMEGTQ